MYKLWLLVLTTYIAIAAGLYVDGDGTVKLTPRNFNRTVLQSESLWYVQFYSESCQYCQRLHPEYIRTAQMLQGRVNFGVVNMDSYRSMFPDISGYPTIYVFNLNKKQPVEYAGPLKATDMYNDALARLQMRATSK
jgi:thioredoxin-like negative regulator of GroEL